MNCYTISKEFAFSAAHSLEGLHSDHPCSRLHGHNYVVRLSIQGSLDETGFVVDYRDLEPFKRYIDQNLDHQNLNDVIRGAFNPTAENLAGHLSLAAVELLKLPANILTMEVSVSETPKTWATAPPVYLKPTGRERYRWGRSCTCEFGWQPDCPEHGKEKRK